MTVATAPIKCSGAKQRDLSEIVRHKCKATGNYGNKCPNNKSYCWGHDINVVLPTQNMVTLGQRIQGSAGQTADACSSTSFPCFCAATDSPLPCCRELLSSFVATSSVPSAKKGGLKLVVDSGCSSRMTNPAIIPNTERHLCEYQALQPPKVLHGVRSHE